MELYKEIEVKMKGGVTHFQDELKHLRTGRASLAIFEGLTAEYYGTPTPINQLANLSVADASLIVAQPFDPTQIAVIEKAIQRSSLGLNPSNDGKVIRIPIPQLTEERRKEIVRRAHEMAESARNSIRMVRREGNDRLKTMEKEKEIGQDDERRGNDEMQKLHDRFIAEINQILKNKETMIMEV